MEKAREHNTKVFMLIVDLRKAYYSIPRQALWLVLQKYDIPAVMINVIRSLHNGMKAEVLLTLLAPHNAQDFSTYVLINIVITNLA